MSRSEKIQTMYFSEKNPECCRTVSLVTREANDEKCKLRSFFFLQLMNGPDALLCAINLETSKKVLWKVRPWLYFNSETPPIHHLASGLCCLPRVYVIASSLFHIPVSNRLISGVSSQGLILPWLQMYESLHYGHSCLLLLGIWYYFGCYLPSRRWAGCDTKCLGEGQHTNDGNAESSIKIKMRHWCSQGHPPLSLLTYIYRRFLSISTFFPRLSELESKTCRVIINPHDDTGAERGWYFRGRTALLGVVCTNQIQDFCGDASTYFAHALINSPNH